MGPLPQRRRRNTERYRRFGEAHRLRTQRRQSRIHVGLCPGFRSGGRDDDLRLTGGGIGGRSIGFAMRRIRCGPFKGRRCRNVGEEMHFICGRFVVGSNGGRSGAVVVAAAAAAGDIMQIGQLGIVALVRLVQFDCVVDE